MSFCGRFFIDGSLPSSYLHGSYNVWLVLLSIIVSIFSATMTLHTAEIARNAHGRLYRNLAIGTGTSALGGGIWSMHFIGMLALELPMQVHYHNTLTIISVFPAVLASWLALTLLSKPRVTRYQLLVCGSLVGLGIGAMHYAGMAAMYASPMMPLTLRYEPFTFALSIVVAVVLATLSLWVRYGLHPIFSNKEVRWICAGSVMGIAIAAMHYTGMAAVRFIGTASTYTSEVVVNNVTASLVLSMFTLTVTVMAYSLNNLIRSRELYQRMESSKTRLRATLETAVDGIITIDGEGLILGFNQSAERLFGWAADEVMGRNISMLMPEPDRSQHDGYLHNYHRTNEPKIIGVGREVMGLRKDGSLMPMRLAVGRIDLPGERRFVGFVTDISERHALEASLRETAQRAELAAAAKSTFLANMSHEIRTPMNSIIGFTELLLQTDLTATQRNQLNTIRQSSRSLLGLINDILDTTRMEKGHLELESIDFSLKALAMQIESSLRLGAHAKNLRLSIEYPPQMPEYFCGDPLRLLQVLNNLTANAIKFTETGEVRLAFSMQANEVHIEVHDTGIGMTGKQMETIFAPFTQADPSISRRFGGTGLGTTIVRQLVELMGGRIEVNSELGHGSVFHVWLPLALGQTPSETLAHDDIPKLAPLKILIADDVQQNLELLTLILQRQEHQVVQAHDGQQAVAKYISEPFDVVLMDVHMPGIDGLQATRLIRQYERTQDRPVTPIIALTASVLEEDRRAAEQAGMNGFAVKPIDVPRLFQEIQRVLPARVGDSSAIIVSALAASAKPNQTIDIAAGTALWGSEARLVEAISQFLKDCATQYPLPATEQDDSAVIDWMQVGHSLHGMRGAAGNLALNHIHQLAAKLETLVRQGDHQQLKAELPALQQAFDEAREQLQQLNQQHAPAPPLATRSTDWAERIRALITLCASYEINDELLEQVYADAIAVGRNAEAQTLRTAIDNFDFEQAQAALHDLLESHKR